MKYFTLPIFLDTIIGFICFFIVSFVFLRLFNPPLVVLIVGSLIFSASITTLFSLIKIKKQKYSINLKKSSEEIKRLAIYLSTLSDNEIIMLFTSMLNKQNIKIINTKGRYILLENICIIGLFLPEAVSNNEIIFYIRNSPFKSEKFYVFSNEFLPQTNILNVTKISTNIFYNNVKELSPDTLLLSKTEKTIKLNIFKRLFSRTAAPRLIFYGIFLLLTSCFVFFTIYYIIFGSLLSVYGFISLIFAKDYNKKSEDNNIFKNKKDE